MTLWQLSACEATDKIRSGEITSVGLVEACLERATETDQQIGAWTFLDRDMVIPQAEAMDDLRRRGRAVGRLHGVPIGVSDIFGTQAMPTGWGTSAPANTRPADSAIIDRLHEAGAVCMGKTATGILDSTSKSSVHNPHNGQCTAGDTASGAAAAVATGHVPLSIAMQSNGSVISSASYCGVYGFKPTRGMISRRGSLETSSTLDQVGVLGRSLEDVAALADSLSGYDPSDRASFARPRPNLTQGCQSDPPVEPCFAWIELSFLDDLPDSTRQGFDELLEILGEQIEHLPAPKSFDEIPRHHQTIQDYELAKRLNANPGINPDQLSTEEQAVFQRGQKVSKDDYKLALAIVAGAEEFFQTFFHDYDAIIAPSTLGEAPPLADQGGAVNCSTIWTFAGLPCLSAPILAGETGLPVGVQLVGSAEEDDRLFRTAAWLERHLNEASSEDS